jgi:hypothetical protein
MTAEDYGLARRMWHQLEPVHAVFWYTPEVFAEAAALGYEQPLGADRAPASPATATADDVRAECGHLVGVLRHQRPHAIQVAVPAPGLRITARPGSGSPRRARQPARRPPGPGPASSR